MKKSEILSTFEKVDPYKISGNAKQKEISKLYLEGIPIKEIASQFNLSRSRIMQIVEKQARYAIYYKRMRSDPEFLILIEKYRKMYENGETISLSSELDDMSLHFSAMDEAREKFYGDRDEVKRRSYIIRIELEGSDPTIWRRVIIPAEITFRRLHDVIQSVTNFQSGSRNPAYHLYEFDLSQENMMVTSDEEKYQSHQHFKKNKDLYKKRLKAMAPEMQKLEKVHHDRLSITVRKPSYVKIDSYLEKYEEIKYRYDFSDDWCFIIKLEEVVDDYYFGYPTLLDGEETAPPEDVGGIIGFYTFKEIYEDEYHPDHQKVKEWWTLSEYREYNLDFINSILKGLNFKTTEWDKINHHKYQIIDDKYRKK